MVVPLFGTCVEYQSITFSHHECAFPGTTLPPAMSAASPGRRVEFLAGRFCAHRALERLLGASIDGPIGAGPQGAPVWPHGVVGSITHSHGFAAAAVALTTDAAGIGIDSERILTDALAREIAPQVAPAVELAELEHDGLDPATLLTLVFSAKESVFKCLYATVGRYFDFHDARVRRARRGTAELEVELRSDLGSLGSGTRLSGRFFVDRGFVHTGIMLVPSRPCRSRSSSTVGSHLQP